MYIYSYRNLVSIITLTNPTAIPRLWVSGSAAMPNASSVAIAGGAIASALIDVLISKKLITAVEAADIGRRAQNLLVTDTSAEAAEASRMIASMLIGPR